MQRTKDTPVFDHGRTGAHLSAEREDEPGDETWHDAEDEGHDEPASPWYLVPDSLFHPERVDFNGPALVWKPVPPRSV